MSKKYIFAYGELLELEECSENAYWWHCPNKPGLPLFDPHEDKLSDTKMEALDIARSRVNLKLDEYKSLLIKINDYVLEDKLDNSDN